jgi:ribose/xylose/arabinose/galactoside ABC-type transport system permease subunit
MERRTLLGKYSFAIGGNRTAAVLSGVNADSIVFLLYVLAGLLAGFCGVLLGSRLGAGDPNVGQGF